MARKKTKKMREVEERYHRPLEKLLPEMYNEMGLPAMSDELGISRSTLWYWLLRYGISVQRVAVSSDETLEIKKSK